MKRHAVWLTDLELRYLNWLAGAAVPLFVLVHQPWIEEDRRSRLILVAFGVGFAAAFWFVGRMRHRGWAAFASFLMIIAPWSFAYLAALPYVVFAFWLLRRAGRDLSTTEEPPAPT